jgi:hypothetical protein
VFAIERRRVRTPGRDEAPTKPDGTLETLGTLPRSALPLSVVAGPFIRAVVSLRRRGRRDACGIA